MNSEHTRWTLLLLANWAAYGQPAGAPKAASASPPAITILTAPTGALIQNLGTGSSALNLGPISYFRGASVTGASSQKVPNSFVITTRFALRVDCPGSPASSQVNLFVSRVDSGASYAMAIDGIKLGTAPQTLEVSMPCGSAGEHRLDLEVPTSTPSGSIGSTVAFKATFKN